MTILFQLSEVELDILLLIFYFVAICILSFFTISTLIQYFKKRERQALYLILSYICFIIVYVLNSIARLIFIFTGEKGVVYNALSDFFHVFFIFSIITIFLFYNEFSEVSKKLRTIVIIIGLLLIIFTLIFNIVSIFTFESEGEFRVVYIIWLVQTIYGCIIYLYLAYKFIKISKTAEQNQGLFFGVGNICFFISQILFMLYAFLELHLIFILAHIFIITAYLFYFIAIYLPKYR